ncbi:hypothetical protein EJ08DRAFT_654442 [Tothia fuscella]|uniref:Uncharacterized protein n=1 Tax=Tothia fuscella TaxID=1048955 RepID=A0A9P4NEQ6_9PEZI|nr:hypothetical protein EJ08DRAFT_654442 [Tothia fuscella]
MDVSFSDQGCIGLHQFDKESCLTKLRTILNGCDTSGLIKRGGWLQDSCAVYRLLATKKDSPDPLFVQSTIKEMIGDFTCADTVDLTPGLAGTCTCFYSGLPSATATFRKPDGGCSKVTSSMNPKNNS